MNIKISENADTICVIFEGDIDLMGIKELKDTLFTASKNSNKNIEVDLRHANYLDSSGIGMFLTLDKMQRDKGLRLQLLNIPENISRIFELSTAENIFKS